MKFLIQSNPPCNAVEEAFHLVTHFHMVYLLIPWYLKESIRWDQTSEGIHYISSLSSLALSGFQRAFQACILIAGRTTGFDGMGQSCQARVFLSPDVWPQFMCSGSIPVWPQTQCGDILQTKRWDRVRLHRRAWQANVIPEK